MVMRYHWGLAVGHVYTHSSAPADGPAIRGLSGSRAALAQHKQANLLASIHGDPPRESGEEDAEDAPPAMSPDLNAIRDLDGETDDDNPEFDLSDHDEGISGSDDGSDDGSEFGDESEDMDGREGRSVEEVEEHESEGANRRPLIEVEEAENHSLGQDTDSQLLQTRPTGQQSGKRDDSGTASAILAPSGPHTGREALRDSPDIQEQEPPA